MFWVTLHNSFKASFDDEPHNDGSNPTPAGTFGLKCLINIEVAFTYGVSCNICKNSKHWYFLKKTMAKYVCISKLLHIKYMPTLRSYLASPYVLIKVLSFTRYVINQINLWILDCWKTGAIMTWKHLRCRYFMRHTTIYIESL